jgi:predicted amino acid-binding ACT domain protein
VKVVFTLMLFMLTVRENEEAAMLRACLRDCGKEHGLVIYLDDEAAFCECADWNAQGRLEC